MEKNYFIQINEKGRSKLYKIGEPLPKRILI